MSTPAPELKTGDLLDLLAGKYPRDRYALFFDVPDNVGLKAHRRADAIAVGCWGSVGHKIDGFELKVSRSDWLREVASVEKADPFIIERCDRWWLVTSSPSIAKPEEIPACWGWMAATKGGLRIQKPAPALPQPADGRVSRLFLIAILRKMQEDMTKAPEVQMILRAANEKREEDITRRVTMRTARAERDFAILAARVKKFEEQSGLRIDDWRLGDVAKLAKAIEDMTTAGGDYWGKVAAVLEGQENTLQHMLECVRFAREQVKQVIP